jgi:hypothetical protein
MKRWQFTASPYEGKVLTNQRKYIMYTFFDLYDFITRQGNVRIVDGVTTYT